MEERDFTVLCPFCHKHTALHVPHGTTWERWGVVQESWSKSRSPTGEWYLTFCNSCSMGVLVRVGQGGFEEFYPNPMPLPVDERIPEFVANDIAEARTCLSAGAFKAAAILCRRALQSICIDKGIKSEKRLSEQIFELAERNVLTKDMVEWGDSVRLVGNDIAHPKDTSPSIVTEQDASDILDLVDQMARTLYVAGAIAKTQKERLKKK